jgi:hypothetical protein
MGVLNRIDHYFVHQSPFKYLIYVRLIELLKWNSIISQEKKIMNLLFTSNAYSFHHMKFSLLQYIAPLLQFSELWGGGQPSD